MAIPFKPVNLGDARHGGCLRPSSEMSPFNHWNRDMTPDLEEVVRGLDAPTTVATAVVATTPTSTAPSSSACLRDGDGGRVIQDEAARRGVRECAAEVEE